MNNKQLLSGFGAFTTLALATLLILFNNSTPTAEFTVGSTERFLGREPCNYIEAPLGLNNKNCEMIGQRECENANNVLPNNKGDPRDYPAKNCLTQCLRDLFAQCEHASSAFNQEGLR